LSPETNCRRKILLQKHIPYDLDPRAEWGKHEGTAVHAHLAQGRREGWHYEEYLPDQMGAHDAHPKVRVLKAPWGKEIRQVEAFPGYWTRVRLDRASPDYKKVWDYKTTKYPFSPKYKGDPSCKYQLADARDEWPIQLSITAHIIELLGLGQVEEMYVWLLFRGAQRADRTWMSDLPTPGPTPGIPIRRMHADELWGKIGEHVMTLQGALTAAYDLALRDLDQTKKDEVLRSIAKETPPDGMNKQMFNGWLCREGCPVRDYCMGLEGGLAW
jgi:hypothetical protein